MNEPQGNRDKALERALASVVGVHTFVPGDALTADVLGTERLGSGVVIRDDGLLVTIGYLVTEAERVWISFPDGHVAAGDVVGIDQTSGLALVRILERAVHSFVPIGSAKQVRLGGSVVMASGDGTMVSARLLAKQEFTGYWEYRLEEALITAPAHGQWGGAALLSPDGRLIGIGSLHIPGAVVAGETTELNMSVPIDLLVPVQDELLRFGRTQAPARPWLGVYAHQVDERLAVGSVVRQGPASSAGVRRGDIIVAVGRTNVRDLSGFYEAVWRLGTAGVDVPLVIERNGKVVDLVVQSGDRRMFLKQPTLH
ncbi:MAG: S1C family serine protease [Hyphomicrobiaceae bacterium]